MSTNQTKDLSLLHSDLLAKALIDHPSYLFIGKPTSWALSDRVPPVSGDSYIEKTLVHYEMLLAKRIYENNVMKVIPRVNWASGVQYDMYRHDYSRTNVSFTGAFNLQDAKYVVVNSNRDVYVCLDNGTSPEYPTGVISTVEPRNLNQSPFYTSDGYQWLYLYSVTSRYSWDRNYFLLENESKYIHEPGSIYTVIINHRGTEYSSSPEGVSNQIPYYYCRVVGDGEGAIARVSVEGGKIQHIQIVRPGKNYTYAKLDFLPNRVYKSLEELDENRNALNPEGDGRFDYTVILSPSDGWGRNLPAQLGSVSIMLSVDFSEDELSVIRDCFARQIGVISDPRYSNSSHEFDTLLHTFSSIRIENPDRLSDFKIGEKITQKVYLNNETHLAKGTLIGVSDDYLHYIQNPYRDADMNNSLYHFSGKEVIYGEESKMTVNPDTSFNGFSSGIQKYFKDGYSSSDIVKFSGNLIYLNNVIPIRMNEGKQIFFRITH